MASLGSPSRRQKPAGQALSRSALKARDALVLEPLPLALAERFRGAVALASASARRLFPLVEREDLIQVAREALVRSAPRCRAGEPTGSYLRGCITGALRLTVLEGLSLRAAAAQQQISPMAVSHREVRLATLLAQKKAIAALHQQLVGAV